MDVTFRPIDVWPGEVSATRQHSNFSASYSTTLELLDRELNFLKAKNVVIQLDLDESQIRLDGLPRATSTPSTPRVIVAFDSKYGPLKYATDKFWAWQDNLRAIALSLESLRRVDRYGVTKRGEQYTGWKALGSGIEMGPSTMSYEEAAKLLILESRVTGSDVPTLEAVINDGAVQHKLFRLASKHLHPDVGGNPERFKLLTDARNLLEF